MRGAVRGVGGFVRESWREAAALFGVFLAVTGAAELLGAENLGTAAAFGQIAFMLALVYILLRR